MKKKKTKKKINKQSKTYLKRQERLAYKKALKVWSKTVRDRDGNKCVICGRTEYLNAHHIIEKIYYKEHSLNPDIGITLCPRCHKYSKTAAHMNAIFFVSWLIKNRPDTYKLCLKLVEENLEKEQNV